MVIELVLLRLRPRRRCARWIRRASASRACSGWCWARGWSRTTHAPQCSRRCTGPASGAAPTCSSLPLRSPCRPCRLRRCRRGPRRCWARAPRSPPPPPARRQRRQQMKLAAVPDPIASMVARWRRCSCAGGCANCCTTVGRQFCCCTRCGKNRVFASACLTVLGFLVRYCCCWRGFSLALVALSLDCVSHAISCCVRPRPLGRTRFCARRRARTC